ncbi:unnamed protein product [Pseudo-nitzschia multistriata]|uniref:Uncharacterized protein n=1 Tax=Pseudo-nitzschia multistriata TaxID=183589 RepID=A0A448Z9Y9_9STRA|nr:unnamed protein product [Pseudo-nitzschia multistriata]
MNLWEKNLYQSVVRGERATPNTVTDQKPNPSYPFQSLRRRNEPKEQAIVMGDDDDDDQFLNDDDAVVSDCSLCQGLPMEENFVPFGDNSTCSELEEFYYSDYKNTVPGESCINDVVVNMAFDRCCRQSIPKYECETNIQERLFGSESNYNTAVPPVISMKEPLTVLVSMVYFFLQDIDTAENTAKISLQVSFTWVDPRLKWDIVDNDTCSNKIDVFSGHEIEQTMIWIPDYDLLNGIEGIRSMPTRKVQVTSSGRVQMDMFGGIEAFCPMSGLANIPFDTLGCQFVFWPREQYNALIKYELQYPEQMWFAPYDGIYKEWQLVPDRTEQKIDPASGHVIVNFYFKRAKQYYIWNILVPTIILTYLSFFTFLLDMRVGERLGFGTALALVVVAQQIVTSDKLPVSDQPLWLDKFVGRSFYWVLVPVVQSALVGFLYFLREDRQATKENKNLELMSMSARLSMMRRAASKRNEKAYTEDEATGEEQEALVDPTLQLTDAVSTMQKENFLYTFSFRKFDMICLALAATTYSAFIVIMYTEVHGGFWVTNEPPKVGRNGTFDLGVVVYNTSDPTS